LSGLTAVGVSIGGMPMNVEPMAAAVFAKLREAKIRVADGFAHLGLNAQVVRSTTPGLAAFTVEVELTQLVDVRANGRRMLVPTWHRRRLGLTEEARLASDVSVVATAL